MPALDRIDELVAEQRRLRRLTPRGRPPEPEHLQAIASLQVLVDAAWDEIRLARASGRRPALASRFADAARSRGRAGPEPPAPARPTVEHPTAP